MEIYSINLKSQAFVDLRKVKIKGGKGGDGLVSFLHTKETEWGGPDGGDGGNGGHVIFQGVYFCLDFN